VLTACPRLVQPLLTGCPGIDRLVAKEPGAVGASTVQALLPSLPGILGTTLATVPVSIPYLSVDPARVTFWRQKLAAYPGFKIGIVWQGSSANVRDRWRSVPLLQFAPLVREGVKLFSLQVGPGHEQLTAGSLPV